MTSNMRIAIAAFALAAATPLAAQQPDRSRPPELAAPPRLSLPLPAERTLGNGLEIMLMEKHDVPIVQINVIVRAGAVRDPDGKIGLASLTADMLDEGAGSRDALELADAIDYLGADLSTTAGDHTTVIRLFTPVAKLDDALPILADVVLRPRFPADELERKRKSRLTTLLQWHDQPAAIANALINQALFPEGHPYGDLSIGDESSIRAIAVGDLQEFHDRYFRPNNAVVIVVGDVTLDEIQPKIEAAFGRWARGDVPDARVAAAPQVGRREVLLVDKPGAAQSEIRIGRIGTTRADDEYYALTVLNTILGGAFTSRLNQNLREDKGYTYGARSSFAFRPAPGPFIAASAVQTDATDKALSEFFKEFAGIRQPIPAPELSRAKNYVALRYPNNFQSVGSIAGNLDDLWVFDLPPDYFNRYVDNIVSVGPNQVRDVARKHIDPNRMVIVIVGDREKIEPGIRALNLGPIRNLSIEDVLGAKPALN